MPVASRSSSPQPVAGRGPVRRVCRLVFKSASGPLVSWRASRGGNGQEEADAVDRDDARGEGVRVIAPVVGHGRRQGSMRGICDRFAGRAKRRREVEWWWLAGVRRRCQVLQMVDSGNDRGCERRGADARAKTAPSEVLRWTRRAADIDEGLVRWRWRSFEAAWPQVMLIDVSISLCQPGNYSKPGVRVQ